MKPPLGDESSSFRATPPISGAPMKAPRVGLIVNTYNQVDYLRKVLRSVSAQTVAPDEVLIADDGSKNDTLEAIKEWQASTRIPSHHLWHADEGFRRSRILNQAIIRASTEYLIFLDGDTIAHPYFVHDHRQVARRGQFVQGHRCFVERNAAPAFGNGHFNKDRARALWSGQISAIRNSFRWPSPWRRISNNTKGVRGCNLAVWREDLIAVNGFNEEFVGWGREDTELTVRLLNRGLSRLDLRGWALCFHLWHPSANRAALSSNDHLMKQAKKELSLWCPLGLSQYLEAGTGLVSGLQADRPATHKSFAEPGSL
jgi:glycosyltransferase involved in cell wall biosynthesis